MNRLMWLRLRRWYQSLHPIQQWACNIIAGLSLLAIAMLVTHGPSERPHRPKIILNCDLCGTDSERTISYNEYMDRKEQEQQTQFRLEKQRIQQEIWNDRGHQKWCRNHPYDKNCK
jgi:hypothetical protein